MIWINAKNEKPNPDDYLLVLLSDYENTYYYTDLKGWDEIDDEYGIAWSKLPKHPDQDSTGWNVITDTPFNELDFEDEALVYFKHEDGGYMDIYCPQNACEIEPQYFGEITHWMKIPAIPSYATPPSKKPCLNEQGLTFGVVAAKTRYLSGFFVSLNVTTFPSLANGLGWFRP